VTFTPGADAEELRAVVRGFLERRSAESEVRRLMETETGYDDPVWKQAAGELGLAGLVIPERWGGSEATQVELGLVCEEMGRALWGAPFLSTVVLAAGALLAVGDEAASERYLPGIAGGDTVAALAWGGTDPLGSTVTAEADGGSWTLTGTAEVVVDGARADLLLVVADTPDGIGLFGLSGDTERVERLPLTALDSTRKLARLEFSSAAAEPVGTPGEVAGALAVARDRAVTALAHEQVGGANKVLEMSVEYGGTRVQFGRKIGSFQAIKHRCADMLVEVESARSSAYYAAWASVHDTDDLPVAAALAGAVCSHAYTRAALDNIQNHGGIGFTWEHPAHLYLKRAKSTELLLGSPAAHRARLADLLDIPEVGA
jgi:3-oxochol-4-en-24-oyl-CoA dehydrogenase